MVHYSVEDTAGLSSRQEESRLRAEAAARILDLIGPDETDVEFAERTGLTPGNISNYRKKKNGAGLDAIRKVAAATGTSADALLGLKEGAPMPDPRAKAYQSIAIKVLKVEGYIDDDGNVISAAEARAAIRHRRQKAGGTKGKGGAG